MTVFRRARLAPVVLKDVPYSQLPLLSDVLQKYRGTHYRLPATSGAMAQAVDAICSFPTGRERMLFKLEWPPV